MHIPWRKRVDAKFAKNIESGYMRGFKFDPFDNPRLKELGQRYYLDEVVAVRSGSSGQARLRTNCICARNDKEIVCVSMAAADRH